MYKRIRTFEDYKAAWQLSTQHPEAFWASQAEHFSWRRKWDQVLDWNFEEPKIEWFKGAQLNITENCLDRHLKERGEQLAIIWEPNGESESPIRLTYRELYQKVCRMANVLLNNGISKGDKVCLYMPMIPELAIATLACARIGAVHSIVFAGFSAQAIADRVNDASQLQNGDHCRRHVPGGMMISPLAGITPTKPGFATLPLPGIQPVLVDADGKELEGNGVEGHLCIRFPWPGMLRTTFGDHERCRQTYFSTYKGYYFTGDGARRDAEGFYRIIGRVDDMINVSGHRFSTTEIESAIDEHPLIAECAVVGFPHPIKGQGIYAYVICNEKISDEEKLQQEASELVVKLIGKIARPEHIQIVPGLPKTRSGKIMRRILRKISEGDVSSLGDTSTLLDPAVVDSIIAGARQRQQRLT